MKKPHENSLKKLWRYGQSVWLDDIRRELIHNGQVQRMIDEDGISGITSNPAIFEKAIANSSIYDDEIRSLAKDKATPMEIYENLSQEDVRDAADLFRPVYESRKRRDGFVSLEVNPHLAYDTAGTVEEAKRLWKQLDRPNVMIKVPATKEGLPAITELIREGINVNVTLIFGLKRYEEVIDAYLSGLEQRLELGKPIDGISSVASFFVSRIDVLIDSLLHGNDKVFRTKTAVACSKAAYGIYRQSLESLRFLDLSDRGAQVQRLLWASTGTKNPEESDVKYVEPLIGNATVNTMPRATIEAYRDHGDPANRIEEDLDEAKNLLKNLPNAGIDMNKIAQQLEDEGVEKFIKPFDKLIKAIEEKVES